MRLGDEVLCETCNIKYMFGYVRGHYTECPACVGNKINRMIRQLNENLEEQSRWMIQK